MSDFEQFLSAGESGGGNERSREEQERFEEQMREAAAKVAASRRDEKKAKKRDKGLAKLLAHFIQALHGSEEERMLNTLVLCLKNQMPTELLMALLSIMYPNLTGVLMDTGDDPVKQAMTEEKLRLLAIPYESAVVSYAPSEFNEHHLPESVKIGINSWIQVLLFAVRIQPEWLMARVMRGGEPDSSLIQLGTYLLEQFLAAHKVTGEFEKIRQFAQFIIIGVLSKVKNADK